MTIDSVTGGLIMNGRSDGTLNPGGVRYIWSLFVMVHCYVFVMVHCYVFVKVHCMYLLWYTVMYLL